MHSVFYGTCPAYLINIVESIGACRTFSALRSTSSTDFKLPRLCKMLGERAVSHAGRSDCFAHFVCPSSLGCFLTADLIGKIDAYLCKALRWGYNGNVKLLSELLYDADMKLFRSMLSSTHCIHHQLLPPFKFIPMKLRTSHCAFVLPYCHYS